MNIENEDGCELRPEDVVGMDAAALHDLLRQSERHRAGVMATRARDAANQEIVGEHRARLIELADSFIARWDRHIAVLRGGLQKTLN